MNSSFMKYSILGLILLNCVLIFFIMRPQMNERPFPNRQNPVEMISDQLHLNDDQSKSLSIMIKNHKESADLILHQLKPLKKELFDSLNSDSVLVDQKAQAISDLQQQLDKLTFYHMKDIMMLCNDEQKELFEQLRHDLLSDMGKRRPEGSRRLPPPPKR